MPRLNRALLLSSVMAIAGLTLSGGSFAQSTDLHITLDGAGPITRKVAHFACDKNGAGLGLPAGVFQVEYINGAGNSLAVLPIGGRRLIFANILSGSGARYAADRYTWSDGGIRGAFLASDSLAGHAQTLCRQAN
jgi:membrane-bound inhibitor of C-type lysozyme